MQELSARGVGLRVLAGQGAQIDTTTAAGRLVFGIFAALAEFERELIRERTQAGLKAARARGRKGGRKFALSKAQVRLAQAAMAHRDTSVSELCSELGIKPVTLYRYVGPQGELREQGEKGPRHLNRSAASSTPAEHVFDLSVGFRPLPQTTRFRRKHSAARPARRGRALVRQQPSHVPNVYARDTLPVMALDTASGREDADRRRRRRGVRGGGG